jgi:hypothetical protein
MKRATIENIGRGLAIGICFITYIFLLFSVVAKALDTSLV